MTDNAPTVQMTVMNTDLPRHIEKGLQEWLKSLVAYIQSGRMRQEEVAALSEGQLRWPNIPRTWDGDGYAQREDSVVSVYALIHDPDACEWSKVLVAYADVAEVVNPYTVDLGLDLVERLKRTALFASIDRPIRVSDESKNLFAEAAAEIERLRQEGLALFSANQELRREVERSRAFIDRLLVEVGESPLATPDDRLREAAKNAIRQADVMTERVRMYLPGSSSTIGQPSEGEIGDHMSPAMRRVYDEARKDAQR